MSYNSVSATFSFPTGTVDATTTTNGLSDGKVWSLPGVPKIQLAQGTTAGKINLISKLYQGSLASTTVTYDLTNLLDEWGNTIDFARVKGLMFLNFATTSGFVLKVGAAGANPWDQIVGDAASDKIIVPNGYLNGTVAVPGFVIIGAPDATGLVVGTPKNIQIDSGSHTVPYGFCVFGADA